eukprot:TRINITY_DN12_c0_g1_i1.p1 TRINITY_DN12_c0_g1~~TRINITY_DN12_c0_g1_i1.p1  ORF type:complete len:541 (-),score=84.93 TRINITY_DN12_c0_g1_i1:1883-3505(-)
MGSAQTKANDSACSAAAASICAFGGLKRNSLNSCESNAHTSADFRPNFGAKCPTDPVQLKADWQYLTTLESQKNQDCQFLSRYASSCSEHNFCKNRYTSVLALERTRVRLQTLPNSPSDYINANFVDGIHQDSRKAYIATQAPLPDTFGDFWRMVWDQNVHILVMLTRLVEGGRVKADRYWPTRRPKRFANCDITVRLESIECVSQMGYKIKKFLVERPNQMPRTVWQYHFLDWPDHGVPEPTHLLHMMQRIDEHSRHLEEQDSEELLTDTSSSGSDSDCDSDALPEGRIRSPLLVHCSAGIGRTGAFIVVHTVLHKLREEAKLVNDVDMKALVASIRDQRAGILTGLCQYQFCCDAIKRGLAYYADQSNACAPPAAAVAGPSVQKEDSCPSAEASLNQSTPCPFTEKLAARLAALTLALSPSAATPTNGLDEDDEPSDCEEELMEDTWMDEDGVICDAVSKEPLANSTLSLSSTWYTMGSQTPCESPRESSAPIPLMSGSSSNGTLSGSSSCCWSSGNASLNTSWYTTAECQTPLSSSQ